MITFNQFIETLGLSINASEKACLLFNAYLLIMATTPHQPRTIDYSTLRDRLSKQLDIGTVKQVISYARTLFPKMQLDLFKKQLLIRLRFLKMKKNTLQVRLAIVRDFEIKDKGENNEPSLVIPLFTTCMLYNMQAVLLKAKEKQTPVMWGIFQAFAVLNVINLKKIIIV